MFEIFLLKHISKDMSYSSRLQYEHLIYSRLSVTCHRTAFHDDGVNRLACAEIVENKVCPADFLTAGLGSMHSSPEKHDNVSNLYYVITILKMFK